MLNRVKAPAIAALLGVSERTVTKRAAEGLIPCTKSGSHYYFDPADFAPRVEPAEIVVPINVKPGQRIVLRLQVEGMA